MKRGDGRAKILAAGHEALLKQGRAGIRIDAIAAAAAINKRMIYHYFGDREGLIATILAAEMALLDLTQDQVPKFVASLHPEVSPQPEPGITDREEALRVLLLDALIYGARDESKHSLTAPTVTRRLAYELATILFPDQFGQVAEKPVFRLSGDSKWR